MPAPYNSFSTEVAFSLIGTLPAWWDGSSFQLDVDYSGGPLITGGDPASNFSDLSQIAVLLNAGTTSLRTSGCNYFEFHCGRGDSYHFGVSSLNQIASVVFFESISGPFASYGPGTIGIFAPQWIRIAEITAVPEPATWAMMILGFCGLGLLFHRQRADA